MTPLDAIEQQLQQRFASPDHRVVIWSDPSSEYEAQVDMLSLPGVELLHIATSLASSTGSWPRTSTCQQEPPP